MWTAPCSLCEGFTLEASLYINIYWVLKTNARVASNVRAHQCSEQYFRKDKYLDVFTEKEHLPNCEICYNHNSCYCHYSEKVIKLLKVLYCNYLLNYSIVIWLGLDKTWSRNRCFVDWNFIKKKSKFCNSRYCLRPFNLMINFNIIGWPEVWRLFHWQNITKM